MDPEETYRLMMAASDAVTRLVDSADLTSETLVVDLCDEGEALAKAVQALDSWLRQGGFKPSVWAGDAPSVFDPSVPPGGHVCGRCGVPVESEPCKEHQPGAWAEVNR